MVYTKFYQKERMRRAVKTEKWNQFAGKADRFAAALILVLVLAFMLALTFCAFTQTADLNTNDPSGEHIDFYSDNVFLNLLMQGMLLCALYLFYRHCDHIPLARIQIVLALWVFLTGTLFIASVNPSV